MHIVPWPSRACETAWSSGRERVSLRSASLPFAVELYSLQTLKRNQVQGWVCWSILGGWHGWILGVQGQLELHSKFQTSQSYIVRPCLKIQREKKIRSHLSSLKKLYTHIHTYIYTYIHTYMNACTHMCTSTHTHIYTHTYTCFGNCHELLSSTPRRSQFLYNPSEMLIYWIAWSF